MALKPDTTTIDARVGPESDPSASLWALAQSYASKGLGATSGAGPIPTYSIWGPSSSSSVVDGNTLNRTGNTAQDQQAQIAAENAVLRLIFGRAPVGAQIADVLSYQGSLIIIAVWGQGPINLIEAVYLDDALPPAGVAVVNYDGTQTVPDASLVAAYAAQTPAVAFADVFQNVAYSVVVLPPAVTTGFPKISAMIQGLKLFDHRTGTTIYSENAAVAIGNLQTNATWGAGDSVDWDSVDAVADLNDALVGGTDKRRSIGLVLDAAQDAGLWFETLRAYAGCFLYRNNGVLTLAPDRPTASSFTFSEAAPANCKISNIKRRSKRDAPTVVAVRFTDLSVVPARDGIAYAYAAGAREGTAPWKIREVSMPGITRFSYATREATEQLNKLQLTDLTFDIQGQDEALVVTVGDVVTATANIGIAARKIRVIGDSMPTLGRPVFNCEGYDEAVYSDSVVAAPSVSDTSLPDPFTVLASTALIITENLYLDSLNGSTLAAGITYKSRFDCTWTPPAATPYPVIYRVELWDGTQKIRDEIVSSAAYSSPAVQQGKTYTVKVFTRNSVAEGATPLTGTQTAQGKLLPPGPVPFMSARELGGKVYTTILPAPDIDTVRYEWRYFPNGTGTWATATFIDRKDELTSVFDALPIGTHRLYVRPIDSNGKYSLDSAANPFFDITVNSDANAFLQSKTFSAPTLTNMASIPMLEGTWKPRWATSVAGQTFNAGIAGTVNAVATPVDEVHANGTQNWTGEWWDLGSSISATWTLNPNTTLLNGAVAYYIETSPDGFTITRQPGLLFQGSTRFARPAIEALTSSTIEVTDYPSISLAALARPESGIATTAASAATLIQLTGRYAFAQDIQATCVDQVGGSVTSRAAVIDRILLHPETGLMHSFTYNGSGNNFTYQTISTAARVIAAGDFIEYDVYIDPSSPTTTGFSNGGLYMRFTDATDSSALVGADGFTFYIPATGMDTLARGKWYSRKASMAAFVGKTTNQFSLVQEGDAASGSAKILYRNIRFTDGAGTNRLIVWSSGEPPANTSYLAALVTNVQVGPSNSFNLYAFTTSTGAQVASDARWSFRGF